MALSRGGAAVLLVAILGALAVAAVWAVRVPFFQEPDELAHADYAFAFFDAGGPFVTERARLATTASPQAAYLSRAVGYRAMRYNPYARVTPAYGTSAYFNAIDAGAPDRSFRAPATASSVPYVAGLYPAAYYLVAANVMATVDGLTHSLTASFLASRLFNVSLLGVTLFFAFRIFRRSGLALRESLFGTVAVGYFPMVDWVAGYVQPDNLVAALFAAGLAVALRPRASLASIAVTGLAITATVLTKAHYALALWLAVAPLVALRIPRALRRTGGLLFAACDVILPICAYALSVTVLNPVRHLVSPAAWVAGAHSGADAGGAAVAIAAAALHAFEDAYFGGVASLGFWLHFGTRSGSFVPDAAIDPARDVFVTATILALVAFAILEARLARRLVRVGRRRSLGTALRLALAAAPVNAYAIVSIMLISLGALTRGGLVLQGRYWLPVVTSLAVVLVVHLPKLLKAGPRRRLRLRASLGAAAYSLVATMAALAAMNANFYGRPSHAPEHDSVADVDAIRTGGATLRDVDDATVRGGADLLVSGYAVDMRTGLPAGSVLLSVDGRDGAVARVGRPVRRLATTFNDDAILRSGFDLRIPAGTVDPGTHILRFYVASSGLPGRLPFRRSIRLHVVAGDPRPSRA